MLVVEHRVKESLTITDRIFALKLGELYKTYQNHHTFQAEELNEVFV
jgi:ABC-type lipopolysaccharide export system ATPase subunit